MNDVTSSTGNRMMSCVPGANRISSVLCKLNYHRELYSVYALFVFYGASAPLLDNIYLINSVFV